MTLIKKRDIIDVSTLVLNEINLTTGSGAFLIEGPPNKLERTIKVYYHMPATFNKSSRILIVIPGAGRDADEYMEDWIDHSEKRNTLIIAPMYEESDYPFEDYHLCGLIDHLNITETSEYIEGTNQVKVAEASLSFTINQDQRTWIFEDFDRIFELVIASTESHQTRYDIFGHSAGGQILHRMALLQTESKAKRIIAANSGFYTLPDTSTSLPFGIKGLDMNESTLKNAFSKDLIILTGALDNDKETRGTLLRSHTADQQGLSRLARGKYFLEQSKMKAMDMETTFNWKLVVVPNSGHDHRKMSNAAVQYIIE